MATKRDRAKKPKVLRAKESAIRTIRNSIVRCQRRGIKIHQGTWGVEMDTSKGYFVPFRALPFGFKKKKAPPAMVCALGALLIHKNGSIKFDEFRGRRPLSDIESDETAAYVLGVDREWVWAFTSGFDGCPPSERTQFTLNLNARKPKKEPASTFLRREVRFIPSKDPQVLEHRRAWRMGLRLRKEFIEK